jgi:hypothetical protein
MLRRRILLEQASPLAGRTFILDRMNKRGSSLMGPRLAASMSSYFGSSSASSPISRGPPPRTMRTGETFSSILPCLGHPPFCHSHPCEPLPLCRRLESPLHDPGLDLLLAPLLGTWIAGCRNRRCGPPSAFPSSLPSSGGILTQPSPAVLHCSFHQCQQLLFPPKTLSPTIPSNTLPISPFHHLNMRGDANLDGPSPCQTPTPQAHPTSQAAGTWRRAMWCRRCSGAATPSAPRRTESFTARIWSTQNASLSRSDPPPSRA